MNIVETVLNTVTQLIGGLVSQPNCGILKDGQQYYIQSADGRFAVVDGDKQAAYLMQVSASGASKFTVAQKNCTVYGFCVNGLCMSRCEGCTSDSTDFETVKFHETNSDGGYSQWNLSSVGSSYNLQVDNNNYLTYKTTPSGDQLTLSAESNDKTTFNVIIVQ